MTITNAPELVDTPAWSIRPEQPVDLDQIHELHREAFRGPAEAELVDAIRAGSDFIPALSLVAVANDGSVLGHVLVSRVAFLADREGARPEPALALAPLAVLPPHSGHGIGSALTREVLGMVDERDEILVAVLGASSFYERFGFRPASDDGIRSPFDAAGPAYQVRPIADRPLEPGSITYPAMFEAVTA